MGRKKQDRDGAGDQKPDEGPDQKPARKQPKRTPAFVVYARIDEVLGNALQAHVDSLRPRSTLAAVVEDAVMHYLSAKGLWPPASPSSTTEKS